MLSTLKQIPMCQGFNYFSGVLPHSIMAKLVTTRVRVNACRDFDENFKVKTNLVKYLMEKHLREFILKISLKYYDGLCYIPKLFSKAL